MNKQRTKNESDATVHDAHVSISEQHEQRLVNLLKRQTARRELMRADFEARLQTLAERRENCRGLRNRIGISRTCCPKCRGVTSSTTEENEQ